MALMMLCTYQCNPRLPLIRADLRWGKVGICITENYNSPPTGEVLAMQTPTKSRPANPRNTGAGRGFVRSCGVGIVMS